MVAITKSVYKHKTNRGIWYFRNICSPCSVGRIDSSSRCVQMLPPIVLFCSHCHMLPPPPIQFYNFIHTNPKLESITKEIDCCRIRCRHFHRHVKAHFKSVIQCKNKEISKTLTTTTTTTGNINNNNNNKNKIIINNNCNLSASRLWMNQTRYRHTEGRLTYRQWHGLFFILYVYICFDFWT